MLSKIKLSTSYNLKTLLEVTTGIDIQVLVFNVSVISAEELGSLKQLHNTSAVKEKKACFSK